MYTEWGSLKTKCFQEKQRVFKKKISIFKIAENTEITNNADKKNTLSGVLFCRRMNQLGSPVVNRYREKK